METPPRRQRVRVAEGYYSPVGNIGEDGHGTPEPTRARIRNLEGQVEELVRKLGAAERKLEAVTKQGKENLENSADERALLRHQLEIEGERSTKLLGEVKRCHKQGALMRDEIDLSSVIQQQKAALAAADEQLQTLELERRQKQTAIERVVRDHKVSLLKSREADLLVEAEEKEARIAELEAQPESANTSLAHQRAAESKAQALISSTQGETRAEITALEGRLEKMQAKVSKLEETNRGLAEKEAAARDELTELRSLQQTTVGSSDKEMSELRAQLRAAKSEATKHEQAAATAQEEAEDTKSQYKDLLKSLKEKYKEAKAEAVRLAGIEEELAALKSAPPKAPVSKKKAAVEESPEKPKAKKATSRAASPQKAASKAKARKASPVEDSDDESPKKKAKKEKTKALREKDTANRGDEDEVEPAKAKSPRTKTKSPKGKDKLDETPPPAAAPEKKKKRRILGGAAPAFTWDPILNSGDGVIPTFLSPVASKSGRSVGTIPRAGFPSLNSRSQRF